MAIRNQGNPATQIQAATNRLLRMNEHTRGREAGQIYLGSSVLIVELNEPLVIDAVEGVDWWNTETTVGVFDLMDAHQAERGDLV